MAIINGLAAEEIIAIATRYEAFDKLRVDISGAVETVRCTIFIAWLAVAHVGGDVLVLRCDLADVVCKGMRFPVQGTVDENDFPLRPLGDNTFQHGQQRCDADSGGKQHQRALVVLGEIQEKLATWRADFNDIALGFSVEQIGDGTFRLRFHADSEMVGVGRGGEAVVPHGRAGFRIWQADGEILAGFVGRDFRAVFRDKVEGIDHIAFRYFAGDFKVFKSAPTVFLRLLVGIDLILTPDKDACEKPVSLAPCGDDFMVFREGKHLANGGEEVLAYDWVMLREDAQTRVLLGDSLNRCAENFQVIDVCGEGADCSGQRALLGAARLVGGVKKGGNLGVFPEHAFIEMPGQRLAAFLQNGGGAFYGGDGFFRKGRSCGGHIRNNATPGHARNQRNFLLLTGIKKTEHPPAMPKSQLIRRAILASDLQRSAIFKGLPEEDMVRIAGYATRQSLVKDEILFEEGGEVRGFYIVTKGLIKAYRIAENGREQLIHLVHPDESFAEPAIAGLMGYPAHTKALEKTEVILIPATEFLAHLRERPDLSLRILGSLSRHLHELVTTIENYKLRDVETRLLHWLIHRSPDGAPTATIRLAISKGTLAAELGTRQETLSRILAKLRDSGEIHVSGREITIVDTGKLRRLFANQLNPPEAL